MILSFRLILIFLMFLLFPCFAGCAHQHGGTITILHTNDMHAQYTPMKATWVQNDPQPLIGGIVALEYHVNKARADYGTTLLVDAGDIMTGTPLAKIKVADTFGGGFIQMLNDVGYDVMTIGNHEFDEGQENLHKLIDLIQFDVVSANLYKDDELVAPKPYTIFRKGDLRIGVIGITLTELFEMTAKKNLDGIRVLDPATTAQTYIDEINPQTDLIVLLTHQGVEEDRDLAKKTHGADIIVGGHSHSRLNQPIVENGVLIVQADSKSRYLGRLTVQVEADSVANYEYNLIPVWVDSVKQTDASLAEQVKGFQTQIDAEYGKTIGELLADWDRASQEESNIGNYIADVVRETTRADFAVINSGGIRKDMKAGPIRKLDIVEILPFTNYVVTFSCSGEELLTLARKNARAANRSEPGILQISGLNYSYRVSPQGDIEIMEAKINGKAIDAQARYRGATIDYVLFGQTDRYFGFNPTGEMENTNLLLSDVVMEYIEAHPRVQSKVEARIVYQK